MKQNFQKQLDIFLSKLSTEKMPTMLLHSCCGPCSTYVLSYLAKYFHITVYFYNPNIMPESEYKLRLETQKEVLNKLKLPYKVNLIDIPYDSQEFLKEIKGLENEPEHGIRCEKCMDLRIKNTAKFASENGFDYFCTTLSVSPHKDAVLLNALSEKYASLFEISTIPADFKKQNGFLQSIKLSKELQLYRQDYCGCIFSIKRAD